MKVRPLVHRSGRPSSLKLLLRTLGVVVAATAFAASIVQVRDAFRPREGAASPTIVVEPPVVVVPHPEVSTGASTPTVGATAPVSGPWDLHTVVEQCTYQKYQGLRTVYRLNLIEARDGSVTGTGELWSENGEEVSGLNHLIMSLRGHFDGFTLRLTYELGGRTRPSTGALYLEFDEASGAWRGRFDSTIAASSGQAELHPR